MTEDRIQEPESRIKKLKISIYIKEFIGDESYINYLIEKINQAGRN